jgi:biopolymer transport protein ExbD
MSRSRFIRNKNLRRPKRNIIDLDITSLLDILVILLVFLLNTYNSSGVIINVPKEIKLPKSESLSLNKPGVIIQVAKEKLWVESKVVIDFENPESNSRLYDHGGRRIIPLYDELTRIKEEVEALNKQVTNSKPFSGVANLVVHKEIKYQMVKKILYTLAISGFQKYKFVVLGMEQ